MLKDYFEFQNPVKICAGYKALDNIGVELAELGGKRAMIISDKGVEGAGLLKTVLKAFDETEITVAAVFTDIPSDSSYDTVRETAEIYRAKNCDSLVAVGGGSVIDTAKGANILASLGTDDLAQYAGAGTIKRALNPFIVVPTTSGTGSEATLVAVIADKKKNQKSLFLSKYLMPNTAIIDPRMTLSLPPIITAATAMDALTHSIEAFTCLGKNPLSDAYATSSIKLIAPNILRVIKNPNDKEGRYNLAVASTMAGVAFSNSMVGLVHTLGHSVGAVCHVHHGIAMNVFLPIVLEYNLPKVSNYVGELLLPLAGADAYSSTSINDRPVKTIDFIRNLKDELYSAVGLPRTLGETGKVAKDKFAEIAKTAIGDASITYNPVEMDYNDALALLEKAF
ncbi:MAG TPA: iron-containing alcohol dehydrogenase [Spirochaetota bacterium]|nr:iron-containing alcohol dehydrogenase [Spirochaetota bacterium]HOS33211.1 iron-containing alcohol dehydrogenase [Spirochaetota bacterium]HOS56274.1 iron-containing alcohol dehydrogenase [Spirochaetota bacterium]HPK61692.1 iron-containing alcohol dehydrogenase [Spirochaetota bacterium]HQF77488.1 iron-containing alcohol dehydrogenase [Spirochaetota bacterium]